MARIRIALANLPYAANRDDSVARAVAAIRDAGAAGAALVCFPEAYVPGYRSAIHHPGLADAAFLDRAWAQIAKAAGEARAGVILGTERVTRQGLVISALVVDRNGRVAGFQDKTQIDPSEEGLYVPSRNGRHIFTDGDVTFGVSICHEGWRYPETVRWPAKRGAQIVFHPHFHWADAASYRPSTFADPRNTFHEKAALCRAAENTCYFAMVNYASDGSPTTSAIVNPDGTLLAYQPYGQAGLLVADIELDAATRLLAIRCNDY